MSRLAWMWPGARPLVGRVKALVRQRRRWSCATFCGIGEDEVVVLLVRKEEGGSIVHGAPVKEWVTTGVGESMVSVMNLWNSDLLFLEMVG